jgi:hypothetical protein
LSLLPASFPALLAGIEDVENGKATSEGNDEDRHRCGFGIAENDRTRKEDADHKEQ